MSGLFDLALFNLVTLGVVLLIGIATARWIRRPAAAEPAREEDQPQP